MSVQVNGELQIEIKDYVKLFACNSSGHFVFFITLDSAVHVHLLRDLTY